MEASNRIKILELPSVAYSTNKTTRLCEVGSGKTAHMRSDNGGRVTVYFRILKFDMKTEVHTATL